MIGAMSMPANFQYKDVFLKGYPRHEKYDSFRLKHPSMDYGRRAKIFSPFDALKGFNEAVAAKEVLYEYKRELSDNEKEELNRRLSILHTLTFNGRIARANRVKVSVTYYVPCADKENFAYGYRGQYVTVTGTVWNVDTAVEKSILVDRTRIHFSDIVRIESEHLIHGQPVFAGGSENDWSDDCGDWCGDDCGDWSDTWADVDCEVTWS